MEPKYILFDMDGVLADSRDSIIATTKHTLAHFGREFDPSCEKKIIGPPLFRIYNEIFGFDKETAEEATKEYRKFYSENALDLLKTFPGVREMLEVLTAHDKKLIVCTARYESSAEMVLEKIGIRDFFCFIGGLNGTSADGVSRTKKADVIRYIFRENGITDPENAVMVGDRKDDIDAAIENNIASIGVTYGFGNPGELDGATVLASSPEEIAGLIINGF